MTSGTRTSDVRAAGTRAPGVPAEAGDQAQRTELSWARIATSCWAVALIVTKAAFPLGLLALPGAVAVTAVAYARCRDLRALGRPSPLSPAGGLVVAAACLIGAIAGLLAYVR